MSKDRRNSVEQKAIQFVLSYETAQGREPEDVSRDRLFFRGMDIVSRKGGKIDRTIEVKGTSTHHNIPDAFESEFGRSMKLVATHLYLVATLKAGRPLAKEKPTLYIVPRAKIKKEHLEELLGFRFKTAFYKEVLLKSCKIDLKK